MELNNIIIANKNIQFGREMIKFFKKEGIDTVGMTGNCTIKGEGTHVYYGIVGSRRFNCYTLKNINHIKEKDNISIEILTEIPHTEADYQVF